MDRVTLGLLIAMSLLTISGLMEFAFIIATVSFLEGRCTSWFDVTSSYSNIILLHGLPANLIVDHGHTSNGAAGTAFVLVGFFGFLVLSLRKPTHRRLPAIRRALYNIWLVLTVLSALLTLAALIYTFVVTGEHVGQTIDLAELRPELFPNATGGELYRYDVWTPEAWFAAVLQLNLTHEADRQILQTNQAVAKGWHWNLIPMLVLGIAVCGLAFWDRSRFSQKTAAGEYEHAKRQDSEDGGEGIRVYGQVTK